MSCYAVPINQGAIYTILSLAKSRDKLKLVNFESGLIKVFALMCPDSKFLSLSLSLF